VDFKLRQKFLRDLKNREAKGDQSLPAQLLSTWRDGRLKMFITYKALQIRRSHRELFCQGDYLPLTVSGPKQEHVVAFARRLDQHWVIVLAGRFFSRLTEPGVPPVGEGVWGGNYLSLPGNCHQEWREEFTGRQLASEERGLPIAEALMGLPVAMLTCG
jgi:(1->4)-alpha-D-glucan 1-alpha-D-glucosylmutase